MDLPKNGSVVIIDDKIEEAFPLMNALAKRGVPYSYYDGKSKNYPEKTLDNVRIIFWICIWMKQPVAQQIQKI